MANISEFNSAGIERVYWAVNSVAGYPYGVAGSIANGADASLGRIFGTQSFGLPMQAPRQVSIPGDDSVQAIYFFAPETLPNGDLVLGNINLSLWAKSQGIAVYADGAYDGVVGQPDSPTYNQLTLVTLSQAKSAESGTVGNAGWFVKYYPRVQIVPMGDNGLSNAAGTNFTHRMIASVTDKLPWGESMSIANHGTLRGAVYQLFSDYRQCLHTHVSNASDTNMTLAYTPAAATAANIQVWRNGTLLTITTDWSVSGSVITLVSAGSAGDVVVVRYGHT